MTGSPDAAPQKIEAALVPGLFTIEPDGQVSLVASRCGECHGVTFPGRKVCPRCRRFSMAQVLIGQGATLFSYTVCHAAPAGWQAPYLQAYVELPEGLRIFTLIGAAVEPRTDALEIGMRMQLEAEPVHGHHGPLTYKYLPAEA